MMSKILAAVAFTVVYLVLVLGLQAIIYTLFLGAPFLIGMISGALLNRERPQTTQNTLLVSVISVTVCGGALLLFALEGVLCLTMAAMLAYPLAALGALVGRAWAVDVLSARSMVIAWPLLALMPWERA